ncbi:hypothetical protein Salat_2573500 [Sesamum alatum]|uniref:Myb/SANT-like domain-containing protein n=1 Tax=Sesamum alatum TaxID=300844 RepID=A0AAE1XTW5_9LAMI|nr:hypothetical protein Salat_2573500 [Sesamum alatum]
MSAPEPKKPQRRYFYSGRWSKGHDHAFVTALAWKAMEGKTMEHPFQPNKEALEFASACVSTLYRWEFRPKTYAWHLDLLRKRYITFKAIVENPTFEWDAENNIVNGTREAWEALIRENPFGDAYVRRGDPEWENLKLIFRDVEGRPVFNGGEGPNVQLVVPEESYRVSDE